MTSIGGDGLFEHGGRFGANTVRKKLPATSASRLYELKIGNAQVTAAHLYELLKAAPGTRSSAAGPAASPRARPR